MYSPIIARYVMSGNADNCVSTKSKNSLLDGIVLFYKLFKSCCVGVGQGDCDGVAFVRGFGVRGGQ